MIANGNEFFQGLANCDSLVRINLEFGNQITKEEAYQGCEGDICDEANPNGMEVLPGLNGTCDTLVSIELSFSTEISRLERVDKFNRMIRSKVKTI